MGTNTTYPSCVPDVTRLPLSFVTAKYDRVDQDRERYERHRRSSSKRHAEQSEHSSHSRKRRSISIEKHVETLVVVDTEMVQYYENEDIETYVLTVMNMVSIHLFFAIHLKTNDIGGS